MIDGQPKAPQIAPESQEMAPQRPFSAEYWCRSGFVCHSGILALTSTDPDQARFEALLILAERFPREPDEIRLQISSRG
jgi:hypothetical protein